MPLLAPVTMATEPSSLLSDMALLAAARDAEGRGSKVAVAAASANQGEPLVCVPPGLVKGASTV
jgi:hypothetical protein